METLTAPRRTLGRTGCAVPALGYGSVPIGRPGFPRAEAEGLLHALVDAGVTLIDTAAAYGAAEEVVGAALAGRRDEVVIVTKAGMVQDYADAWSAREVRATLETSCRRLRTEILDVVLLHSCDLETLQRGEALRGLEDAREAGHVRWIGYSGDNEALAWAVRCGRFDVVETSWNPCDQSNHRAILAAARTGLGVLVKRPLANGVPGRTTEPEDAYAGQYWPRWQAMGLRDEDVEGIPWPEVSLRFAAFAEGVTAALTGSGRLDHMERNVAAVNRGPLPPQVVARLRSAFEVAQEGWPGLT
jgi:aryl-alcohol dehydrogenase-like predicted oxidoreductase